MLNRAPVYPDLHGDIDEDLEHLKRSASQEAREFLDAVDTALESNTLAPIEKPFRLLEGVLEDFRWACCGKFKFKAMFITEPRCWLWPSGRIRSTPCVA